MSEPLTDGYNSLSKDINKIGESDIGSFPSLPELELSMDDDELIALKNDWIKDWKPYAEQIEKDQKENEDYWLGKHFSDPNEKRPLVDNLIFESLETFLPIATRPKPDPIVDGDINPESQSIADKVRKMLIYLVDLLAFNLVLKQVARYWALYLLGVMKVGWSMKENDITCMALRPQKLILDPKATIENCEYTGNRLGELLDDTASDLILRFPKKKQFITDKVKEKMGTKLEYYVWWTPEYMFWTLQDEVLDKKKNPHWNYDTKQPIPVDNTGIQPMSDDGKPQMRTVPGKNHFKQPKIPYIFLAIFNLGKQPHDETNLIKQNISLQDSINKRLKQMDYNADNANGGLALSGDAFTEEQAAKAGKAKRKGGVIWVPTGAPASAVVELQGSPLPQFVYQTLTDYRNELRNIFGTRGSTPQGTQSEQTVRGKLITKSQDSDRIGGGISVYLEQFADVAMNWFVQLMYVYYDEPHVATILGKERTKEYIQLSNAELGSTLLVSVKDGSMVPTDPMAKRSEAVDLYSQQALDPITLFERLDFPNPRESAKNLFLWLSDPIQLFPDLAQAQAQAQANQPPATKPPSESISFKDLPPEGQAQMAEQAGIKLHPMQIAMHQDTQRQIEQQAQQASQMQKLQQLANKVE